MGDTVKLTALEEMILIAIERLREDAYGVPVRRALLEATGKDVAYAAVYEALERLELKGFVRSRVGEATKERGGRAKRYYEVLGAGIKAMSDAERARLALRNWISPGKRQEGYR